MIGITTLPHVFWCAHSFVQKKEMLAFLLQNGAPKNLQNYLGGAKKAAIQLADMFVKWESKWIRIGTMALFMG